jgi:List-Bact-rpt repeat protein
MRPQIGIVEVGDYVLEVGDPPGTLVKRSTKPTPASAGSLSDLSGALEEEGNQAGDRALTEAGADLIDDASAATAKVEKAVTLGKGLARGEALDPTQLGFEVDAVLGLLERLDRQGRWKEALRLARALSTLYSLLRRWAALLRSLKAVLRAGEALGDLKAVGWAKHELGTLKVAAGDVGGAAQNLGEAREIRKRVGDHREIAATDHNLRALCEQLRGTPPGDKRPPILRISLPLAILAALLLLAGGLAGGLVVDQVVAGGDGNGSTGGNGPNGKLLKVEIEGDGSGTIRSEPPGIDCEGDCEETFPKGEEVMLTADENDGSIFDGFSPPCDGDDSCELTLNEPKVVKATFVTAYTLTVTVEGVGAVKGGTDDDSNRISCRADSEEDGYGDAVPQAEGNVCDAEFAAGDVVELTAEPTAEWNTGSPEGCDDGTICRVTMNTSREVTVVFSSEPG